MPKSKSQDPSPSLQEIRVAQQELQSGSQTGQVYVRLSPGAVAFPFDRSVAKARIDRHLKDATTNDEIEK